MTVDADNKSPSRSLLYLYKGPGKRQPSKTENFKTITVLLQPNTTEETVAPAKSELGSLDSTLIRPEGKPPPPIGVVSEKKQ